MNTRMIGSWALTALLAVGIAAPSMAKGKEDDDDKGRIRVNVQLGVPAPPPVMKADEAESRAFQSWFGIQVRRYNDTDRDTGERLGDLLQMVADVSRGSFTVIDQRNERHTILVNRNTNVICEYDHRRGAGRWESYNQSTNRLIRRGDLVVVLGFLRSNGDIAATQIRVIGNAGGWFGDGDDNYQTFNGRRAYGDVWSADSRSNTLIINANIGRRVVTLGRDGELLANGRRVSVDYLRRGDRVVFYYNDERAGVTISAYRIVVLRAEDRYPEGDRPFWTDPNYRENNRWDFTGDYGKEMVLDGRLTALGNGLYFTRIELSTGPNRTVTVHFAKSMEVYERDGTRTSPFKLREGQWLRVTYTEVNGSLFAKRIEVR